MFLEHCEWNCIIQMYLNLFAASPYEGLSHQYSEGCWAVLERRSSGIFPFPDWMNKHNLLLRTDMHKYLKIDFHK